MSKHGAIPTLAYQNPDDAIAFLEKALGFEIKNVYHDKKARSSMPNYNLAELLLCWARQRIYLILAN